MSIYDEVIEKLKSVMAKFIIPSVEDSDYGCLYDRCHFYNSLDEEEDKWLHNVYKTLERAKKLEELLELYKELSIIRFYLFFEKDSDLGQELMDKDDLINNQIKQLEEEMK